ncbi:MAG: hypothetical protein LDL11_01165, partial [Desulfarculus sp.]|nr:hypothetical protein [Desulfarculus sp.]
MKACSATHAGLSRRGFLLAAGLAATVPAWLSLADAARAASLASGLPAQANYFERAFGITPADLSRIMGEALAQGGDYCDLYFQHSQGTWIVMEDGVVNRAYTSVSLGMGVRVLIGEQTGYAFSQVLEMPAMLEAARAAASLARAGG